MKKFFIVLLIIIGLSAGGYFSYNWYKHQNLTVWSFIPSDAVMVYQPKNLASQWAENADKKIWDNLSTIAFINEIGEQLINIDSILGAENLLEDFFDKNALLLSAHITSQNSLDVLFALEIKQSGKENLLSKVIKHYSTSENLSQTTRQYLGYTITELSNKENQFSYVYYKNILVGSFTSFLVEDAIRTLDDSEYFSFQEKHSSLFGLSKIENDEGDLYVNSKTLAAFIGVFTDPVSADIKGLGKLTDLSFLDVAIHDESIIFNGFSLNSATRGNYLDSFDGIESSEFLMNSIVPTNTATLFHFSFDDGEKWHKNLKNFWRKNSPELLTNMGELENKYEFPVNDLYEFIGNELGVMTLESGSNNNPDLITALHINDVKLALTFFNQLSDLTNTESDTYSLEYKGSKIRQISVDEVPMRFFGTVFSGYASTYYTVYQSYVLMASSESAMKNILNNIHLENTWSKSLSMNDFLDIANKESNLSLFIKTKSALSQIKNKLNEKWLPIIEDNLNVLHQLDYCAVQFSNIDGKYYTNIVLQQSGNVVENTTNSSSEFISQSTFPRQIITKPFGVRNHNDRSLEFVVQDEAFNFYLLSADLDTLWNTVLEGEIITKIYQIDYYKNNKLQYLFASENEIHIIDRTGTYIPGYPISLPDNSTINQLTLIDYDNSKNYRIIVANEQGSYYMFDKSGKNLEGWNPRKLNGEPLSKPFHLRVRNTDVLVFTHKNGSINVLNRRGDHKKGFPLALDKDINSELFVEKGSSLASTFLTALTGDGELIRFNLEGKIASRKQLFRNNVNDQFQLVISTDGRNYVILRMDDNHVSILDSEGEESFTHDYPLNSFTAQYYNFSSENQVLVLTDSEQGFTYLYDINGVLIGGRPINTGHQIAMLYQSSTNSYKIFLTYEHQFSILEVAR